MSVTVAEQREIIRRRLMSNFITMFDFLSADESATATTLHLTDTTFPIANGTRMGIDNELVLVRSCDTTAHTVDVVRGWLGTTKAAHTSGTIVEISPRFFTGDVTDSMKEEIDSWDERLFRTETIRIDGIETARAYDLRGALDPYCLLEITVDHVGAATDNGRSGIKAQLLRDQPLSAFASGYAVQLVRFPFTPQTVLVTWAEPFITDDWADDTDLLDDVGLVPSMFEVLTYGTIGRLMVGREIGRTDLTASGEDRRASEVPPGFNAKTASDFMALRDRALARESIRLRGRYPYRMQ